MSAAELRREAAVLDQAAAIMGKYRGGLATTLAVLAETADALRSWADGEEAGDE
ncbi:MAG: hypothetical protein J2P30_01500 [Actinobacteria bacterium]|nr:hypothetical protein [Actinomycetota bacterium]